MRNNLVIGLFVCLACVQIIVPFSMIRSRESVLKIGRQFKFKTEPVDPYDAFRGRFVALRVQDAHVNVGKGSKFNAGQKVYALITVDENGFAKLSDLYASRPKGVDYISTKIKYNYGDTVYLDLPFDRYYMTEKSAPKAERLYWKYNTGKNQDAYVVVRVKAGEAVIEALYVGGRPIEEAVKQEKGA